MRRAIAISGMLLNIASTPAMQEELSSKALIELTAIGKVPKTATAAWSRLLKATTGTRGPQCNP